MFDHGQNTAQKTAEKQLRIAHANLKHLRLADKNGKMEQAVPSMLDIISRGGKLTPGQLSYCNDIYEATMRGYGLPAAERLQKPKWYQLKKR